MHFTQDMKKLIEAFEKEEEIIVPCF